MAVLERSYRGRKITFRQINSKLASLNCSNQILRNPLLMLPQKDQSKLSDDSEMIPTLLLGSWGQEKVKCKLYLGSPEYFTKIGRVETAK